MAHKAFDAALKHLSHAHPADWARLIGLTDIGPVELVDADLSTVTAAADKLIKVLQPEPFLIHFEFQVEHDSTIEERSLRYNVLAGYKFKLPVRSVIVLMRPEADAPALNGTFQQSLPGGQPYLTFHYNVVRVWTLEPAELLNNPGTMPLAPIANVSESSIPKVLREIHEKLSIEVAPAEEAEIWITTQILLGLRFPASRARQLFQGVSGMPHPSSTYQAILDEGRLAGARKMLRLLGMRRLGTPSSEVENVIGRIENPDVVEDLAVRLLDVATWDELLATIPDSPEATE